MTNSSLFKYFAVFMVVIASVFSSGCKASKELSVVELVEYMEKSSGSTFHVWSLVDEDDAYFYIEIKTGLMESATYKVSKKIISFNGIYEIPSTLKFSDFDVNK
jgi:hypothetical protein